MGTDSTRLINRTFAGADSRSGSSSPLGGILNESCRVSRGRVAVVSASRTGVISVSRLTRRIGLLSDDSNSEEDNSVSIFNAFYTISEIMCAEVVKEELCFAVTNKVESVITIAQARKLNVQYEKFCFFRQLSARLFCSNIDICRGL